MDACTTKTPGERGKEALEKAGYKTGGSVTMPKVKRVVKRAVREHETEEHGGHHGKITLKHGGEVPGERAKHRPDRQRRADGGGIEGRAMGGEAPRKGGGKPKVGAVNIKIKTGSGQDGAMKEQMAQRAGMQQGMRMGAALGARQAARGMNRPPMPPSGGAGPMGGAPPMMPPGGGGAGMGAGPGGPPPPGAGMPVKDGGEIHVREHHRRRAGGGIGAAA
jgi:hypothetical protein